MMLHMIDIPADALHTHADPASQITGRGPTGAKIMKRRSTSRIGGLEKVVSTPQPTWRHSPLSASPAPAPKHIAAPMNVSNLVNVVVFMSILPFFNS